MSGLDKKGGHRPVCIVVPVYRNLEVSRRALESLLASDLPADASVTVINDASPDPELDTYCETLAQEGRVKLLVNESNKGFVATANRGFADHPEADVLLLNSDTEVAGDWLQRIRSCAYRQGSIGTVTPFSNNATICSYPIFSKSSDMPALWNTAELDAVFRSANSGDHSEIPTAVGYCMFIKRDCLNEVGGFDEANFGMGYGEECDFSMRALARGWRHVIAADVFVFHEGAVSFAAESQERKSNAERIMQDLHPEYEERVRRFIQDDSLWHFRSKVDSARVVKKPEDSANILAESARHQSILKARVADLYEILQSERAFRASQEIELRRSLEKSVWLEQELARALELTGRQSEDLIVMEDIGRHQKAEIESLTTLLEQSRAEFSKTDEALAQAQRTTTQLGEQITQIKSSRSWRYSAWLRKLAGRL